MGMSCIALLREVAQLAKKKVCFVYEQLAAQAKAAERGKKAGKKKGGKK
jgi:hypothetical protein